jgi:hypothetical protein
VIANGPLERVQWIRQDAALAQENRVQPHARALFDVAGARGPVEPAALLAAWTADWEDECSARKSFANPDALGRNRPGPVGAAGSGPEMPVASGRLVGYPGELACDGGSHDNSLHRFS